MSTPPHSPSHFKGKDALGHVIEAQAQGIISAAEIHGTEIPGYLAAACEAAREMALLLPILWIILGKLSLSFSTMLLILAIFSGGWLLWKLGRSAWLGWFRLERLHRVLEQERWEIEHHRQQERDELRVLYAAKGFEGKLLEDVLDVLMADNARLLKVMVEEELGLSLASHEHPLKQGVGAAVGAFLSSGCCLLLLIAWPTYGILVGSLLAMGVTGFCLARLASNEAIPAIIWNYGLWALSIGWVYFMLQWVQL